MYGERCVAVSAGTYQNEFECVLEIEAMRSAVLGVPAPDVPAGGATESISDSLPLMVV